jgi:isopentenyldiphosphate isomerase
MGEDEMFDIVDDRNRPLGLQKSRREAHATLRYWHRVTHIWVVNDKKEILCQQRSFNKDVNPGKWQSFFGGHLKAGQSYTDNAVEELREELGIQINPDRLVPVRILKNEPAKHFGQVYLLRWNDVSGELRFRDSEVASVRWMSIEEIKSQMEQGLFCNKIDPEVEKLL